MKDTFCSWRALTNAMILVAAGTLLAAPLAGQTTDLQVMVSGPWSYVEDPKDATRVVVIAPISDTHDSAELFSGDDASNFKGKRKLEPGVFRLNINNRVNIQQKSSANPYRLQETDRITVDVNNVVTRAIYTPSMGRFAISLPKPDFYSTYPGKGTSQSIISKSVIVNATGATDYTTWMVLHYQVSSVTPAKFTGASDDGSVTHNDDIQFASSAPGGTTLGISIVTMAKDDSSYARCDSYSHDSFRYTKKLWGELPLYGLFPSLKSSGDQNRDDFHFDCTQLLTPAFLRARTESRITLDQIQEIRKYLENPDSRSREKASQDWSSVQKSVKDLFNERLPEDVKTDFSAVSQRFNNIDSGRTTPRARHVGFEALAQIARQVDMFTAGGGDCHTAQFSINGVIP